MEILAILWPIGYVTCEELQVGHNLTMAKGEKQRLYKNIEFDHTKRGSSTLNLIKKLTVQVVHTNLEILHWSVLHSF